MTPLVPIAPVILASASPRRQELLRRVIAEFEVDPADLDEDALSTPDPVETAEHLAQEKGLWVAKRHPGCLVISGDTVVALGSRQLAKPQSQAEATEMLAALSGRVHTVITGVSIVAPDGTSTTFSDASEVEFRALGSSEIAAYVATGEPMDKAGAYAIQGGAAPFVARLTGAIETVIGLPIEPLAAQLEALGLAQRAG